MPCIYCRTEVTQKSRSIEHVLPRALGNEDLVLPSDAVCSRCNNRLGKLDQAVLHFRPIMWATAEAGVRHRETGERIFTIGDPRNGIEFKGRDFTARGTIRIEPGIHPANTDLGSTSMHGPAFNEFEFVRGIHKIALAGFALHCFRRFGFPNIFSRDFDELRRYVRAPDLGEPRTYASRTSRRGGLRVESFRVQSADLWCALITIRDLEFLVAAESRLEPVIPTIERDLPAFGIHGNAFVPRRTLTEWH